MTLIACDECGKQISDRSDKCIGCGAPLSKGLQSGFRQFNLDSAESLLNKLKKNASTAIDEVIEVSKRALKSQDEIDRESLETATQVLSDGDPVVKSESETKCMIFKAALESTIDVKFVEVLASKSDDGKFLSYADAQIITSSVRNIFKRALGSTPAQVDASCSLSEAILAPSTQEKKNLIKSAVGTAGGAAGIGMVIAGIGSALGWGAGMIASLTAAFAGTSVAGPAGWMIAGLSLAAIAGYFATTSNKYTDSERFMKVLKSGCEKSVLAIWDEHGELLSISVENSRPQR